MFPHPSLQQHKEQGALKKHKNNFVQIPAVLFTNLTSSEGWKTAGRSKKQNRKKQKTPKPTKTPALPPPPQKASPKNDMGRGNYVVLVPVFVHPTHFCTPSSAADIENLFLFICAWGQALAAAYAGGTNSSLCYLLSKPD